MSENVGNKWEWIAMKCLEIGYPSASNVAESLGNTERKIYPGMASWIWTKHVPEMEFMWLMENNKPALLKAIANHKPFNIGCIRSDEDCEECKFGHRVGPCAKSGSITCFWERVLIKDCGGSIDPEKYLGLKICLEMRFAT